MNAKMFAKQTLILLAALLLFAVFTPAQGIRYDSWVQLPNGQAVQNALVTVCAFQAAPALPCTPTTQIYNDIGLTQPISNPILTDVGGNFGFYVPEGNYTYTVIGTGFTPIFRALTFPVVGTGNAVVVVPMITGLPVVANGASGIQSSPQESDALFQSGVDPCVQINANWAYINSNLSPLGGINDARAFSGQQPCSVNPLLGDPNLGGTILLGGSQLQAAVPWVDINAINIQGSSGHPVSSPLGNARGSSIQATTGFPANSTLFQVGTSGNNNGGAALSHVRLSMYPTTGGTSNPVGGTVFANIGGEEGTSLFDVFLDGGCFADFYTAGSSAQNFGPVIGLSTGMNGCNSTSSVNMQLGNASTSQLIADTTIMQFSGGGTSNAAAQQNCITMDFIVNLWLESGHCEETVTGIEIGSAHAVHNVAINNYYFQGLVGKPMTTAIDISNAGSPAGGDNILLTNIFGGGSLTNILKDNSATNPCTVVYATEPELGFYFRTQNGTLTSTKQCPDVWPAHNENFSASTFKIPTGPGCVASLSNMLCYDSTLGNTHVLSQGGADTIIGSGGGGCGSNCTVTNNLYVGGQNPWVDSAIYGVRGVPAVFQTTATCVAGLNTVNLASASNFQNKDGINLYGCGATVTVTAPSAPTVTPVLQSGPDILDIIAAPAASTPYSYTIVSRDQNGGMSAQSTAGTTTTGAATLGGVGNAVTVSTLSRTNNIVTVHTAASYPCVVNTIVFVTGSTDPSFSGYPLINACTDSTHFTYVQNNDTRSGCILINAQGACSTNAATGGTVQPYNGNGLSWSGATGPITQYYICKSGSLVGATRSNETYWLDVGAAAPILPDFAGCPSSPVNDYLPTTILSGAGSTTITTAASAINSSSGQIAKFDDAPPFALFYNACVATAATRAPCHLSAAPFGNPYFFNSALVLGGTTPVHIIDENPVVMNETLSNPNAQIEWVGNLGGTPSTCPGPAFPWGQGVCITVNAAYPGFNINPTGAIFTDLNIVIPPNGLGMITSAGGAFDLIWQRMNCLTTGTDITGQCLVNLGNANIHFQDVSFSTNDSSAFGYSVYPIWLVRPDVPYLNPSGDVHCENCFFIGRGFGADAVGVGGFARYEFNSTYTQAMRSPTFEFGNLNGVTVSVHGMTSDTTSSCIVANWNPNVFDGPQLDLLNVENLQNEASGPPGIICGNPIPGTTEKNGGAVLGQNSDIDATNNVLLMNLPFFGLKFSSLHYLNQPVSIDQAHTLFFPLPAPTGLVATPAAGGTMAAASNVYTVTTLGWDGGESGPSAPATCVTSGGNGTCNLSWNGVAGAKGYNYYWQGITHQAGIISTNSASMTANACCNTNPPGATGTGSTSVAGNQVLTPQVTLTSALNGAGVSVAASQTLSPLGVLNSPPIGQTASNQYAGSSACVSSTKAITFGITFNSTPVVLVFDYTTKGGINLTAGPSTTGFTVSCTGATDAFGWMAVGNPN